MRGDKSSNYKMLLLVTLAVVLAVLGAYSYQFYEYGFSTNNQDWANFSTFFGGIIGPLLTFITLIILIRQIRESQSAVEEQLKHLQETRQIESIISELDKVYVLTMEMIKEVHPMPKENVNLLLNSNIRSWEHDFSNKLVRFTLLDGKEQISHWSNTLIYLKSIVEQCSEEEARNLLRNYEYSHIYSSISSLIGHMILHCYRLAKLDDESYSIIRTKLSYFSIIARLLNEAGFVSDDQMTDLYVLQSLGANQKRKNFVDLERIFTDEINHELNAGISTGDIDCIYMLPKEGDMIYFLKCGEVSYRRNSSGWDVLPKNEEITQGAVRWVSKL
ncbi:hypothetical protein MA794_004390 [Vibrio vulnificus]|nr:hypothetical protein [Vibrio vulnificus]